MPSADRSTPGKPVYPALVLRYYLELGGIFVAEFQSVGGIGMQRETETVAEGGVNDFVHVLPGRVKHTNLTLRNGMTHSDDLWNWFQQGLYTARVSRRDISVILGDESGDEVKRWDVLAAYPVKWTGPELRTGGQEVAIETVELAHQGIRLQPPRPRA